jgi:hypothetical protein
MQGASDPLRKALYRRSGGQCECTARTCPHHAGRRRCPQPLGGDAWKAHKLQPKRAETLRNLVALCPSCFQQAEGKTY